MTNQEIKYPLTGHFASTQKCWENIRKGIKRCRNNQKNLDKCLNKCIEGIKKGFVTYEIWQELLEGKHPDRIKAVLSTENFFDLPKEQMVFWERHVQNHPFAALFADERYEKLKKLRDSKNNGY